MTSSTRASLEARLTEAPGDLSTWGVYGDLLQEAGDPRGELIAVQVALARCGPDTEALLQREAQLLEANAEAWFGRFVTDDDARECFAWSMPAGFWDRIRLWADDDHRSFDVAGALADALVHDSARFLQHVVLGLEHQQDYTACIEVIAGHGPLPCLRSLHLGDFVFPEQSEISWVGAGNIGSLWSLLPRLERVRLQGASIGLGTIRSERLRALELITGGLPGEAGRALVTAELPALEQLTIWFGTEAYGGSCGPEHAAGILQNPSLSALSSLALANADFADELPGAILGTPHLPRLRRLDLSMGTLTDDGAGVILANAASFAHLEALDLSENFLQPGVCEALRRALPNAHTGTQRSAGDGALYVSVGE